MIILMSSKRNDKFFLHYIIGRVNCLTQCSTKTFAPRFFLFVIMIINCVEESQILGIESSEELHFGGVDKRKYFQTCEIHVKGSKTIL